MLALMLLILIVAAEPTEFTGRVVRVVDGDTIVVLVDREQINIRLHGIDAPERGQPFGNRSRERLGELCHERAVRVVTHGRDRYGRTIGVVFVDGINVNAEMVFSGHAWQYTRYDRSAVLARYQLDAVEAGRGLWADPNPIPPWEWRRR